MSRTCFWLASLALLLSLVPLASADDVRDLFDGKSLDGWVVDGPTKGKSGRMMWSVEDGRIVCLWEGFGVKHDRGRVRRPRDHGPAQRPDGPGSRPVRTRGCEDQAGGGASSEG
jgi:hypothetical protein